MYLHVISCIYWPWSLLEYGKVGTKLPPYYCWSEAAVEAAEAAEEAVSE